MLKLKKYIKAKIFTNGQSQAVRLPSQFRFKEKEVFVFKNAVGDVVLSTKRNTWDDFFKLVKENQTDFVLQRDETLPQIREFFK